MSGQTVELRLTIRELDEDDVYTILADIENRDGQLSVNIGAQRHEADVDQVAGGDWD